MAADAARIKVMRVFMLEGYCAELGVSCGGFDDGRLWDYSGLLAGDETLPKLRTTPEKRGLLILRHLYPGVGSRSRDSARPHEVLFLYNCYSAPIRIFRALP
jgi:hypothetical protein